jgi:hypothetical protein
LTNADLRIRADSGQAWFQIADLDPSPLGPQLVKRRPLLAGRWHVLSLIVADGACRRRPFARSLLHTAGPADVRLHFLSADDII